MRTLIVIMCFFLLAPGCAKKGPSARSRSPRELAIQETVGDFRQDLVALARQYPVLAGIEGFPFNDLGFTYVNNSVNPRIYIVVVVEDESDGASPTWPVGGERVPGTTFVTALQLECANTELKQKVEGAYSRLKDRLQKVK